jgi:23S rRNA (uracil1939-C5)-methyltransferase
MPMFESACPVAATCGGCSPRHAAAATARAIAETRLADALRKHLGADLGQLAMDWVALPELGGYRRRIRLRVLPDARIGFFNAGKYRGCAVLTASLRRLLSSLLDSAEPYRDALSYLHHLELREPDIDHVAAAHFVKRDPTLPLARGVFERLSEWLGEMHWAIAGETERVPCQRFQLPLAWQYVPIGSFLQVNQAINWKLVDDLVSGAKQRGLATFRDLYAGSGNFTLPLLGAGLIGQSVELDPQAARAARLAAETQNLPHDGFAIGDARVLAAQAMSRGQSFDLIIIDPPRAGVREGLLSMAAIARSHLVYCSCNLDTLARDLGLLLRAGFEVETVTLYDMFAHTEHVESLVWLRAPRHARR